MNNPASELIALADELDAWGSLVSSGYEVPGAGQVMTEAAQALRTAANQSGSERAGVDAKNAVYWAVGRWNAEVANRPLRNVHRRGLDTTWRQVIRRFGGDDVELCGPRHDELIEATPPAQPAPVNIHGKPDGAVRSDALADLYYAIGGLAALAAIGCDEVGRMTGDHVAVTQSMERRRDDALAALRSPRIAAAETSPGDVLAMKEACKRIAQPWPGLTEEEATSEIDKAVISVRNRIAVAIDRLDVKAEAESEAVQDTWFTDSRLPVVAMSGDVESDRVLKLHFRRPVTDQDRLDLTDAMNMKILTEAKSQEPEAVAFGMYDTQMGRSARLMMVRLCNGQDGCDVPLYAHPTTKPEAPAVSVDAIEAFLAKWSHDGQLQTFESREEFRKEARDVAALIAGGR